MGILSLVPLVQCDREYPVSLHCTSPYHFHRTENSPIRTPSQAMLGGSYGVIAKKFPEYSIGALLGVVVAQGTSANRSTLLHGLDG